MLLFHHATYRDAALIALTGFSGDGATTVLVSNEPMPGDGQEWGEVVLELHTTLRGLHLDEYDQGDGTAKWNERKSFQIPISVLNPRITAIHACGAGDKFRHSAKLETLHGPRRPPRPIAEMYPGVPMRHVDAWLPSAIAEWLDQIAEREGQMREEALTNLAGDAIRMTHLGELLSDWEHPQPAQPTDVIMILAEPEF
jgi:hypothetical protein